MANVLGDPAAEAVLLAVPDNFLEGVREFPESKIPELMSKWNQMDELSDWNTDQLSAAFISLRELAIAAHNAEQIVVQAADF